MQEKWDRCAEVLTPEVVADIKAGKRTRTAWASHLGIHARTVDRVKAGQRGPGKPKMGGDRRSVAFNNQGDTQ